MRACRSESDSAQPQLFHLWNSRVQLACSLLQRGVCCREFSRGGHSLLGLSSISVISNGSFVPERWIHECNREETGLCRLSGVRKMPQVRRLGSRASESAYSDSRDIRDNPRRVPDRYAPDLPEMLRERRVPGVQRHGKSILTGTCNDSLENKTPNRTSNCRSSGSLSGAMCLACPLLAPKCRSCFDQTLKGAHKNADLLL